MICITTHYEWLNIYVMLSFDKQVRSTFDLVALNILDFYEQVDDCICLLI